MPPATSARLATRLRPPSPTRPRRAPRARSTATGGVDQASLSWGAATDNIGVVRYNVYRSTIVRLHAVDRRTGSHSRPARASRQHRRRRRAPTTTRCAPRTRPAISAPVSNQASAVVTADTTPPTVSITSPAAGATCRGVPTLTANASDNIGVVGVQFKVDGVNLGAEDTTRPVRGAWNTLVAHERRAQPHGRRARRRAATLTTIQSDRDHGRRTRPCRRSGSAPRTRSTRRPGRRRPTGPATSNNGTTSGTTWTAGDVRQRRLVRRRSATESTCPRSGRSTTRASPTRRGCGSRRPRRTSWCWARWVAAQSGGPMIWVDHAAGRYYLTLGGGSIGDLPRLRPYADRRAVGAHRGDLRRQHRPLLRRRRRGREQDLHRRRRQAQTRGGWAPTRRTPTGFFDGQIDNVRIYDRALSAGEIQVDMSNPVQPETVPPTS